MSEGPALPAILRALRHRNFRLFATGQLISLIGTWMQSVAQSWLIYRLTGSAILLGLAGFAGQIPVLLLAPLGGAVADRSPKRRILVATQSSAMLLAAALGLLTITHHVRVAHVFVLASCLGLVNAFDIPARQAFVVEMVGREDLLNAIALNSSLVNSARMTGPALAGVLVSWVGEGWCFMVNAASYVAVIAGLLLMRIEKAPRAARHPSPLTSMKEGFVFVWRAAPVRALLSLLGLVSLMGMPYTVLMPIFADRILHGGVRGMGILMGAAGIGALSGALTLAARRGVGGLGRWVAFAAGGFGVFLLLFAWSRWFWLSAAILVPAGYCMMVEMASSNTLIQTMIPDRLRGRVMAVYSMMFMGMAPFGALLAGTLAHRLGAPAAVAVGGAACILGAFSFGSRIRALRPEVRAMIVAVQAAGGEPAEESTAATEDDPVSPAAPR